MQSLRNSGAISTSGHLDVQRSTLGIPGAAAAGTETPLQLPGDLAAQERCSHEPTDRGQAGQSQDPGHEPDHTLAQALPRLTQSPGPAGRTRAIGDRDARRERGLGRVEPGLGARLSHQRAAAAGTAHLDAQLVPPSAIEPSGKSAEQPTRHLDPVRTFQQRVGRSGRAAICAVHARLHFPPSLQHLSAPGGRGFTASPKKST